MISHIKKICEEFGDHSRYPEISRNIDHALKNPVPTVELDLKKLYIKCPSTLNDEISAIFSKIIFSLKMFFSRSYRTRFAHSVEVLVNSEKRQRAVLVLQNATRKHIFREKVNQLIIKRKKREKVKKERNEILVKAIKIYKSRKIQKTFVNLRTQIHQAQSQKNHEADIINILAQYLDCKETLKNLDEKKPKGIFALFKGESAEDQAQKRNTLERLKNLNQQMHNNSLIPDGFKQKIQDENDILKVITDIKTEKNNHEKMIKDCEKMIENAKLEIHQLVPV